MNEFLQSGLRQLAKMGDRVKPVVQQVTRKVRPVEKVAQSTVFALGAVPLSLQNPALSTALNHALQELIDAGELDFLEGRCCEIAVKDRRLRWPLTLRQGRLMLAPGAEVDVRVSATVPAFLNLVSQQVDPDTLFFQRQLSIDGDVELGLYIKNLLDALDDEDLPPLWRRSLLALRQMLAMEQPAETH
ncbi:ubiquinone anaerobic biosynthesis accessory factor UbiT [Reinekea blandensis]|uniref:Ubiquinone biosynthesis accessory factor UbiT n=1 Tax=Reinekea blandensis MED297 TaxID=314283 RepID=A4BKD5_9GAMM|nr:SCP2 sterol-binding domain-containing protein [Reinekea blandensis]EAR07440.1 hypothetical protein MED297_19112 [Reinekea sp. MED297] [Reinekea blandensis MED297]